MSGNLFAKRKPAEPAEPDLGAAEGVLVVVRHKSRPHTWSVVRYGSDVALRSYDSEAAAWYHACWSPLHAEDALPKVTDGGWFYSRGGKGFTSDPRFAVTEPASKLAGKRREIDRAIVRFIRAKVGSMDPLEAFLPDDVAPTTLSEADGLDTEFEALVRKVEGESKAQTPVEIPDNPSDAVSGGDGATTPPDDSEPVESDSGAQAWESKFQEDRERDYAEDLDYRRAFNFLDLAENAPSEQGRAYWLARWEALAND